MQNTVQHEATTTPINKARKSKVVAGLLSFYGGWFGAHWFYLGRRWACVFPLLAVAMLALASQQPVWWDSPPLFVLFAPMVAGFIEAMVFFLMADERFDARYNPGFKRTKPIGWSAVLAACSCLLLGAIATMFSIAHMVLHVWIRLGWLDGLNF